MAETIKVSIGAALSSGFSAVFNSAESSVDSLGDSIKVLHGRVGDIGSHKRLQAETLQLGEALDQAKRKTAEARAEMEKSQKPTREQTRALKEAEKEENRLASALDKKTQALQVSSSALRSQGVNVSNLADEERRLTAELERQNKVRSSMQSLRDHLGIDGDKRTRSIGEHFSNLRSSATSAFRDITMVAGAAGAGIFAVAKTTADYGDEVAETANYIGISAQALQEFRGVGMRVGVETEAMDTALAKFSINLGKAAEKGKKGRQEFREMGLNLDQLIKMGPEKAMMRVADAIARMPKHTKQAAAAVEIFGKSGIKMLNVLGGGSKELERMREEVRKTGMVMGPEQLRQADEFDEAWNGIRQTMLGVRNTIGIALLPMFSEMFGKMSQYVQTHGPQIQQFANKLATGFGQFADRLPGIASDLGGLVMGFARGADALQSFLGGWDNLAVALVGVRLAPVAIQAGKVARSVWGIAASLGAAVSAAGGLWPLITTTFPAISGAIAGVAAAISATPIGWIIAGIAAVVGSLYLLWRYFDYVAAFAKGFFDGLVTGLQPVIQAFQPLLSVVGDVFSAIANGASVAWEWIKDLFTPIDATREGLEKATVAGQRFGELVGKAISGIMSPITDIINGIAALRRQLNFGDEVAGPTGGSLAGSAIIGAKSVGARVPVPQARPQSLNKTETNNFNIQVDGAKDPGAVAREIQRQAEAKKREKAADRRSSYADQGAY